MKTKSIPTIVASFLCLAVSASFTGCDGEIRNEPVVTEMMKASAETTAATGIAGWQLAVGAATNETTGLSKEGKTIFKIRTEMPPQGAEAGLRVIIDAPFKREYVLKQGETIDDEQIKRVMEKLAVDSKLRSEKMAGLKQYGACTQAFEYGLGCLLATTACTTGWGCVIAYAGIGYYCTSSGLYAADCYRDN